MKNQILKFEYADVLIDFEVINGNVMVNATQMALIFNKLVKDFTRNENTKIFIEECLKKENSPFISVKSVEDLIISKQKSGTWMHRILALKFAAWLNPQFELWVYATIDKILFDYYKRLEESLKRSAQRRDRMDELRLELKDNPTFKEYEELDKEEKSEIANRRKENSNQLEMFREASV
jgi:hypothetical protein